jgi:hypothetical protein
MQTLEERDFFFLLVKLDVLKVKRFFYLFFFLKTVSKLKSANLFRKIAWKYLHTGSAALITYFDIVINPTKDPSVGVGRKAPPPPAR